MGMIPEGKYRVFCRNNGVGAIRFKSTSKNATDAVEVDIEFVDDPYAGQTRTWTGSFSGDKAADITVRSLRAIAPGWSSEHLVDILRESAAGRCTTELEAVVKHEPYEGRVYERVAFLQLPGGGGTPMTDEALRSFSERMRSTIRQIPQTATAVPPARPGRRATTPSNGARPSPNSPDDRGREPPPPSDDDHGW